MSRLGWLVLSGCAAITIAAMGYVVYALYLPPQRPLLPTRDESAEGADRWLADPYLDGMVLSGKVAQVIG